MSNFDVHTIYKPQSFPKTPVYRHHKFDRLLSTKANVSLKKSSLRTTQFDSLFQNSKSLTLKDIIPPERPKMSSYIRTYKSNLSNKEKKIICFDSALSTQDTNVVTNGTDKYYKTFSKRRDKSVAEVGAEVPVYSRHKVDRHTVSYKKNLVNKTKETICFDSDYSTQDIDVVTNVTDKYDKPLTKTSDKNIVKARTEQFYETWNLVYRFKNVTGSTIKIIKGGADEVDNFIAEDNCDDVGLGLAPVGLLVDGFYVYARPLDKGWNSIFKTCDGTKLFANSGALSLQVAQISGNVVSEAVFNTTINSLGSAACFISFCKDTPQIFTNGSEFLKYKDDIRALNISEDSVKDYQKLLSLKSKRRIYGLKTVAYSVKAPGYGALGCVLALTAAGVASPVLFPLTLVALGAVILGSVVRGFVAYTSRNTLRAKQNSAKDFESLDTSLIIQWIKHREISETFSIPKEDESLKNDLGFSDGDVKKLNKRIVSLKKAILSSKIKSDYESIKGFILGDDKYWIWKFLGPTKNKEREEFRQKINDNFSDVIHYISFKLKGPAVDLNYEIKNFGKTLFENEKKRIEYNLKSLESALDEAADLFSIEAHLDTSGIIKINKNCERVSYKLAHAFQTLEKYASLDKMIFFDAEVIQKLIESDDSNDPLIEKIEQRIQKFKTEKRRDLLHVKDLLKEEIKKDEFRGNRINQKFESIFDHFWGLQSQKDEIKESLVSVKESPHIIEEGSFFNWLTTGKYRTTVNYEWKKKLPLDDQVKTFSKLYESLANVQNFIY